MELRHIRYFIAAAEELNISRASRRLNISQPAVSHLIRDLEEELATVLFVREQLGLRLTAAGEKFLAYARQIIDLHNEAVRVVGNISGRGSNITIGFVALSINSYLGAALRKFRKANPGISIKVYELALADQVKALRKKQIDVALIDNPRGLDLDEFEKTVLFELHLVAVIPEETHELVRRQEVSLMELAKDNFIGFCEDRFPGRNQAIVNACWVAAGFKPEMHYKANSLEEVLAMIGSGAGVSLLPTDVAGIPHPGVALMALREKLEPIRFIAAWRRNDDRFIIHKLLEHFKMHKTQ